LNVNSCIYCVLFVWFWLLYVSLYFIVLGTYNYMFIVLGTYYCMFAFYCIMLFASYCIVFPFYCIMYVLCIVLFTLRKKIACSFVTCCITYVNATC
jgi:hypothetical protein